MEATAEFSASNRSGNTQGSLFDCRLVMFLLMKKNLGQNFFNSEIGDVFACDPATRGPMVKCMVQADLAP
jgi:hypothetical protein